MILTQTTVPPAVADLVRALIAQTTVDPRPYQERLIGKTVDAWVNRGLRSVLIESPTGSGKTLVGLLAARALADQLGDELAIGWVCMRRNLLGQAEQENHQKGINAPVDFISMFTRELPSKFLVETYDENGNLVPNPDCARKRLLIIDEAQHDAAATMASIHSRVRPDYIMGLTATPFRTDRVKLCFDLVLKDAGLAALIRDGYLSQYRHWTMPRWSVQEVVRTYLRDRDRWGKTLIYFHRLSECAQAHALLRHAGVSSDVVTGSSDRDAQLDAYYAGRTNPLINCMVLTEGFNSPDLETVFARPSCKGVTIQACGRAFRKHPMAGNDQRYALKNIVQAKKGWPFIKLTTPAEQYIWKPSRTNQGDGQWLSLKVNPNIDQLNCKMLAALAELSLEGKTVLPDYITKAKMSARGRTRRRRRGT